jgi:hypothetical protein
MPRWVPVGAAVACMFAAAGFFVAGQMRSDGEKDQAVGTAAAAVDQRDEVVAAAGPVCQRAQKDAQLTELCAEVQAARKDPVPVPAEQVDYQRVRGLVDDALSQDPRLSEAALLAMVRQVYQQNPPKDGEAPTEAEMLALIRQVYAENPPEDGADGTNGQNAFCYDNPDDPSCQPREGRPGTDGADGAPGQPPFAWTTNYPDGSREECRRAEEFDPAAPRYVCQFVPAQEPPPTTEPTETTGGGLPLGG